MYIKYRDIDEYYFFLLNEYHFVIFMLYFLLQCFFSHSGAVKEMFKRKCSDVCSRCMPYISKDKNSYLHTYFTSL